MASNNAVRPFGAVSIMRLCSLDAVVEGAGQFGAFIEADQEKFILRICRLEKLQRRFSGLPNLLAILPLKSKSRR